MRLPRIAATASACLAVAGAFAYEPETAPPLDRALEEHVEVRLVLLDVVVVDKDDRTVPGLGPEDFRVAVEGAEVPLDSVDAHCSAGAMDDPTSGKMVGWTAPPDLAEGTRRVVFAFDYLHLRTMPCPDDPGSWYCHHATRALETMMRAVETHGFRDEEIMVAALTGGLRVEQPFTRDRSEVVATLRRMEYDVSLYAGHFSHLNERPLFEGLEALFTVLRDVPGPKAVVLVTAGSGPQVLPENANFARAAAMASDARVSFYPVDVLGLYARAPT